MLALKQIILIPSDGCDLLGEADKLTEQTLGCGTVGHGSPPPPYRPSEPKFNVSVSWSSSVHQARRMLMSTTLLLMMMTAIMMANGKLPVGRIGARVIESRLHDRASISNLRGTWSDCHLAASVALPLTVIERAPAKNRHRAG